MDVGSICKAVFENTNKSRTTALNILLEALQDDRHQYTPFIFGFTLSLVCRLVNLFKQYNLVLFPNIQPVPIE